MMQKITKKQLRQFLNNKRLDYLGEYYSGKLPSVSFLFVTYNRCPSSIPEKNPLVWSFQTLLANKFCKIRDFVVVDDNSSDYTIKTINWLRKKYDVQITYLKNRERKGCSFSRRMGLKYVRSNLVLMGDDDCLYSEYFIFGSLLTYYLLKKDAKNLAVINFPVYERNLLPNKVKELSKIGKWELKKTFFYHNFDKFPLEYLDKPEYLDKKKALLKPFRVDTFSGVNLCVRDLILKSGDYSDLSMWPNSYSEHIEISYKLMRNNFLIFHQPDPRISCMHLKYGAESQDKLDRRYSEFKFTGLKNKIGRLVNMASIKRLNSGSRLTDKKFYFVEIGTFFSLYLKISKTLGIKFAEKEYKNFVLEGRIFSTTPSTMIKLMKEREKIWIAAIKMGCEVSANQSGIDYLDVYHYIINQLDKWKKNQ